MILAIYGTGGAGKETYSIVNDIQKKDHRLNEVVFIDDTKPIGMFKEYACYPFDEFQKKYSVKDVEIHVALGELATKEKLIDKVTASGYTICSIVHPDAVVGKNVKIARGAQIKMGAVIGDHTVIGKGSWIQAYATIGSHVLIGDCVQVSAKASIGDSVHLDHHTFIGMHAVVAPRVHIYPYAIVAMGAIVNQDLAEECVCMGNPGRVMSKNKEHKVF